MLPFFTNIYMEIGLSHRIFLLTGHSFSMTLLLCTWSKFRNINQLFTQAQVQCVKVLDFPAKLWITKPDVWHFIVRQYMSKPTIKITCNTYQSNISAGLVDMQEIDTEPVVLSILVPQTILTRCKSSLLLCFGFCTLCLVLMLVLWHYLFNNELSSVWLSIY